MDKNKLLNAMSGPDEKLLFSKALDRALLCEKRGMRTFSGFLDPLKAEKIADIIRRENICNVAAYGGAAGCERQMLGFCGQYDEIPDSDFPIIPMEIDHQNDRLAHRDFLGSVLGLGITREKVGDVFLFPGKAVVFLDGEIADFVCGGLEKVGNTPVRRALLKDDFLIAPFHEGAVKNIVVSSLRLDTVIGGIFNLSRGKAAKLIESERAFVNWQCVKSPSKPVKEGDNITLRGFGRGKLEAVNGKTKKDNISIQVCVFGK